VRSVGLDDLGQEIFSVLAARLGGAGSGQGVLAEGVAQLQAAARLPVEESLLDQLGLQQPKLELGALQLLLELGAAADAPFELAFETVEVDGDDVEVGADLMGLVATTSRLELLLLDVLRQRALGWEIFG
jgi:hypothetical protein